MACHGGNVLNSGGTLQIMGVPTVYKPDSIYILTVQLASTQNAGAANRKWGFEITAVGAADGHGFGTLALSHADTTDTRIISGAGNFSTRRYIQHISAGTRTGQVSPATWTLRWTAPSAASATTRALFFAAGNAANGNGSSSGDFIYTTSATSLPPARVSAVASLDFGTVITGATAQQTLQVSNSTPSPADVLNYDFSSPAGFTAPAGPFSATAGGGPNGHTLSMLTGTSGNLTGNLVITANDPVTPAKNVALSGTVLDYAQPSLDSLSTTLADSVDFGALKHGQFRDTTVRVFDLGFAGGLLAQLNLTDAVISGGDEHFSIVGGFSPQLVAGIPASIAVRFDDTGATLDSTYSAELTITSTDEPLPGALPRPDLVVTLTAHVQSELVGVDAIGLPGATRLLPVQPNPALSHAALGFALARRGELELSVYDVRGRHVRSLTRGSLEPGRYSFEWNGRDEQGVALPAGVYFIRLIAPGLAATQRLVLLR